MACLSICLYKLQHLVVVSCQFLLGSENGIFVCLQLWFQLLMVVSNQFSLESGNFLFVYLSLWTSTFCGGLVTIFIRIWKYMFVPKGHTSHVSSKFLFGSRMGSSFNRNKSIATKFRSFIKMPIYVKWHNGHHCKFWIQIWIEKLI